MTTTANTANETRAAKKRRYVALREQGVGQTESRLLVGAGRTTSWRWDDEAGLSSAAGPDRATKAEPVQAPSEGAPSDGGDLREHLERDVAAGVLPAGVFDAFDEPEPDPPEPDPPAPTERDAGLTVPPVFNRDKQAPSRGLLIGVGQAPLRGTFGTPNGDGPLPSNTSGPRGSAVRLRLRVRAPIPYGDDARIGSWR